jgi:hypothetical protein
MVTKPKRVKKPTEVEIDRIVVDQADDEAAWEAPVLVRRSQSTTIAVSAELAVRAAFLPNFTARSEWRTGYNVSFKSGSILKRRPSRM